MDWHLPDVCDPSIADHPSIAGDVGLAGRDTTQEVRRLVVSRMVTRS